MAYMRVAPESRSVASIGLLIFKELPSACPKTLRIVISTERRNLLMLQTLNNRSLTSVRDDSLASFRTDTT
jgi:hypothetical protein